MDEFGTISSDADDVPYGYGYVLVERGTDADAVRAALSNAFPNGLHFKNYRGGNRKVAKANGVVALLPNSGRFYCGAHVCTDPNYGRDKYFRAVSGQLGDSDSPSTDLMDRISTAPVGPGGIVNPSDVVPKAKGVARLLTTYSPLIRLPIVGLLKTEDAPDEVKIHAHIGEVGRKQAFQEQLALIASQLTANWEAGFQNFVDAGVIGPRPCHLVIEVTTADAVPLFGVADMFADVAHHFFKDRDTP